MNSERVTGGRPESTSEHGPDVDERGTCEDDIPLDPDDESVVERDLQEVAPEHAEDEASSGPG